MPTPILATKLYIPAPQPKAVLRPRLIERLNEGLPRKLTLISAAAGYGKTTLVSEWLSENAKSSAIPHSALPTPHSVAWLSLDEGDNDPARFLTYLVAALQTIAPQLGAGVLVALQSPQPPPAEAILTGLLNEIAAVPDRFVLVLDDYHVIEAKAIEGALAFLIEHLPPPMHLVIATREDPQLPLARLRARGQLTELRAADLRFTPAEAADFLNGVMGLPLSAAEITALEGRTEGWIAGLHLAALSMQGNQDTSGFIQSFTGSHRFVLDYLVEEVLHRQPATIQTFLLRTSILQRLCGPLCDAILLDPAISGQAILEYLEQANLFIVPLDNERRWYRYHHLFAELLRQRLLQGMAASPAAAHEPSNQLRIRASQWCEENELAIEAFHYAAATDDVARTERLLASKGMPLHFRGVVTAILAWLAGLPTAVLNARPWLWWRHAAMLLVNGHTIGVQEKLDAAEAALQSTEFDDRLGDQTRNFVGRIATARSVLALTRYDATTILIQARRALAYLAPDNLSNRANANWTLGFAHFLQGDRAAAGEAYREAIALSQAAGDTFATILAMTGLGYVQETGNQLHRAAQTYQHVLQLAGDQPLQIICEAHLGLARIRYEWNDLTAAEEHGQQSLYLARQYESIIDRFIVSEIFLARLKMAQGDVAGAAAILAQADRVVRQCNFGQRIPDVVAAQVLLCLRQGDFSAASQLVQAHPHPLSQARVQLAQGDPAAALTLLATLRQQVDAKQWADEQLRVVVLQALAHQAQGEHEQAVRLLGEAQTLAEPEGFIRTFVDEGLPMAQLLAAASARGIKPAYCDKLLAAFPNFAAAPTTPATGHPPPPTLIEPLSERELEVLQLIAQGLSNQEICARLFLALSTVKGHNQRIFAKLQVQRRTEAIVRARELGLV